MIFRIETDEGMCSSLEKYDPGDTLTAPGLTGNRSQDFQNALKMEWYARDAAASGRKIVILCGNSSVCRLYRTVYNMYFAVSKEDRCALQSEP